MAMNTGKGEPRLNLNIINHPLFRKGADQLINKLEKQLQKYHRAEGKIIKTGSKTNLHKLRNCYNPQKSWIIYKEGILKASMLATQSQQAELVEICSRAMKDI